MGFEKTLWVTDYVDPAAVIEKAKGCGVVRVAVWTKNSRLLTDLPTFKKAGLEVFGWRYPSTVSSVALAEAKRATALFVGGLDGYIVDPEQNAQADLNWDSPGVGALAEQFCKAIVAGAAGRPFWMTSHGYGAKVAPHLPWAVFFNYCSCFLPQAYWRTSGGLVDGGDPDHVYQKAFDIWTAMGVPPQKIQPMAGELQCCEPGELSAYAKAATNANVVSLHFYTYSATRVVESSTWKSVADVVDE
jgi:hypothetical protein